ncbi:serine hydrolase domain-containing protein [Fulvivirgaceae bacterium BMA10]|uniref:Serine hydrolase domain-containing protein n=1 Tax=Splendidivirga corallicola TaxID=3051826 RepID=A0ABT8KW99_9BACT|nr:serine hydrolase domain-containing protein [Fulvivirgaceae bacterium BMA10]
MMKLKLLFSYLLKGYLLLLSFTSIAQTPLDYDHRLSEYLEIQNRRIGFNGIVMVVDDDGHVVEKKIGLASREFDVPVQSNSKFKIASMTKSLTALLINLAEQEGKLMLDDKISLYFQDLPDDQWNQISIRHLMSHTSGVPHWSGFDNYWSEKSFLPLTQEQILIEIFKMELAFEPGSQFAYSSPAYYLLATILEKIYSDSFDNLLQKKILRKLNLKESGTYDGLTVLSNMSSGYHLISDDSVVVAPARNMATMKGGGNMYATARDVTTWCRSFLTHNYWGTEVIASTFMPMSSLKSPQKDQSLYGRGWYLTKRAGDRPEVFHLGGGTFGYSCNAAIYPEKKWSIVVLTNVSFLPIDDIRNDIEKIVFGLPFELPEDFDDTIELSSEQLKRLVGGYQAENGMVLNVIFHQGSLYAKLGPNPPLELHATDNLKFFSKKIDIRFAFQTNEANEIEGLEAKGRGRIDYFQRQ